MRGLGDGRRSARYVPPACALHQLITYVGPIMQCRRIEVRAIRPHKCAGLDVKTDRIEHREFAERPEQTAAKHGLEIDDLFRPVGERHR